MRDSIQTLLNELSDQNDKRNNVFDVQIHGLDSDTLSLSGRLLNQAQLSALKEVFSNQFPELKLESASIKVLDHPNLPCFHVATNLTGLYENPTFGMPLSSELTFGTELEILDEHGNWFFTKQADGYLGWAYKRYLAEGEAQTVMSSRASWVEPPLAWKKHKTRGQKYQPTKQAGFLQNICAQLPIFPKQLMRNVKHCLKIPCV